MKVSTVYLKKPLDEGQPTEDLFELVETELSEDIQDGEVLVQVMVMSVDPYLRNAIKTPAFMKSANGMKLMSGFTAGKVLKSNHDDWKEGDLFGGAMPYSTFLVLKGDALKPGNIWKLTGLLDEQEIEKGIGILGMPGATAYSGVVDILRTKKDDVVFCSAASGAVGSLVGQIAKIQGAKMVIGTCGGEDKCEIVKSKFGYDHAIDYRQVKTANELIAKVKEVSPEGIDCYFENVGSIQFDAALKLLKYKGRIALCGAISGYNAANSPVNEITLGSMIYTQQRIEGWVSSEWLDGTNGNYQWLKDLSAWLQEGKIQSEETIVNGVEQWPSAFCSLFQSGTKHIGKLAVKM